MRKLIVIISFALLILMVLYASAGAGARIDMNTEAGVREYLAGEWFFRNTSDIKYYSCRMSIDPNLNAIFEFYGYPANKGKEVRRVFNGKFSFLKDADTGDETLQLELPKDSKQYGGDYLFLHRTIYDKRRVMSLFYSGNDACLLNLLDPSVGAAGNCDDGFCPSEMVFVKETGEEYDLKPALNAEFHAVYWGEGNHRPGDVIWLDDISWPPPSVSENYDPLYDGDRWYIYETTKYDNETPVSVAYGIADGMKIEGGGKLRYGEVYLVNTNERGEITKMRNVSVSSKLILSAACYRNPEEIAALIKEGADVNAKTGTGKTVLMWAASSNRVPEVIAALIKNGANVNARDKNGWTALMFAAYAAANTDSEGKLEFISLLLKNGADAKVKNNDGKRAIDYLSEGEYSKTKAFKDLNAASK